MSKTLLDKNYDWESLFDVERDVYEAIEYGDFSEDEEFKGTIKIVITYEED